MLSGILNISPEKIQAVDMDSINAPIHYSFLSGNPSNYREFFEINPNTGAVKQIKAVDTTVTKKFDIIIKVSVVVTQRSLNLLVSVDVIEMANAYITLRIIDNNTYVTHIYKRTVKLFVCLLDERLSRCRKRNDRPQRN